MKNVKIDFEKKAYAS